MDLAEFRSQFPIARTRAYLFSGAQSPAATTVSAAYDAWGAAWTYDPLYNYDRALTVAVPNPHTLLTPSAGRRP
jgi:hypothetical protein